MEKLVGLEGERRIVADVVVPLPDEGVQLSACR
jgi:hypothetical protein